MTATAPSFSLVRWLCTAALVAAFGHASAGCGHGPGGKLPVDSPIYEYIPPDDLDDDMDDDADSDDTDADDADAGDAAGGGADDTGDSTDGAAGATGG